MRCKGRLWCGLPKCPILEAAQSMLPRIRITGKSIFGASPPSVFVGRFGYPNVWAGPLVAGGRDLHFTGTPVLYGRSLEDILSLTSPLIRASRKVNVKKIDEKIISASQEIAMSERSVDTEIWVEKITPQAMVDDFFHPMGPKIEPRRIDLTENPVIPRKVDMVVEERLKAKKAVEELYGYGYNVDYLQRLLSSGVLGKDRKLVPTRWSITAVDDMLAKKLLREIRGFDTVDSVEYYYNAYMGNKIHILLLPGTWEYEMMESWLKGTLYSPTQRVVLEDYEPFIGRKEYASNITGAYYAARLSVAEYLHHRHRQAKVLVYREITPEYKLPLGVWVIRETVRHAFNQKVLQFDDVEQALKYMENKTHVGEWFKNSKILYNLRHQKRLDEF